MNQTIKVLNRPARLKTTFALDSEFRAANWVQNRLLDFEFEHQEILDAVCPELQRVGKLLARLKRRKRWRERASEGSWAPQDRPELKAYLEDRMKVLKAERNASPRWKTALNWPRDKAGEKTIRHKSGETEEAFKVRQMKAFRTRREVHALEIYRQRRCHWGTFNARKDAVNQAVKKVLSERKKGLHAELRRPRFRDDSTLTIQASNSGFEILNRQGRVWTMRMRLHEGWVTFKSKMGNHHKWPEDADVRVVELTRKWIGNEWRYSVSITVRASWEPTTVCGNAVLGIDTGHRQLPSGDVRAWVWYGQDGKRGEVVIPARCVEFLNKANELQAEADKKFLELGVPFRNRHSYRKYLWRLGVRTIEQVEWMGWENQQERRISVRRRKARNIRNEIYLAEIRRLRALYGWVAIDVVGQSVRKLQIDRQTRRLVRRNRELVAAYTVKALCDRYGMVVLPATTRNSSKECPQCGHLCEKDAKLEVYCPACETVRDQDYGAAYVMMKRAVVSAREQASKEAGSGGE